MLYEELERQCRSIFEGTEVESAAARLGRLLKVHWDWSMADRPENATATGYPRHHDRWTDWSDGAIENRRRVPGLIKGVLGKIKRDALGENDRLSYDILWWNQDQEERANRFKGELLQVSQMHGVQQEAAQIVGLMPVRTAGQRDDVLARLESLPLLVDQTIALLERGLREKVVQPRVTMTEVPQQIKNQMPNDPKSAPLLAWLEQLPRGMGAQEREAVTKQAVGLYREKVCPAFERLHRFMDQKYLPGCRDSVSWRELPDGNEWYEYHVAYNTTTDLTPDQVFEIGMSEVRRIRGEMDRVIMASGFTGDFAAFCEFLRTDERFFCKTADELLVTYRDISKRVDPELARLFGRLPQTPYGVIPIPSYAEKSQTTAYYQPGSFVAGRPGYFYANTYNLKARPKWEMEALTLHEAVPGHHLHIGLMQELTDLPDFRRQGWITAYGEGWALYAESLGEEMGFYADPYSKFGQLTYEMWRAIRLVVDPGIHSKGWTRRQAIDFFMQNSSKTEHDVTVEIDRYIVWPGQALSYKIGELKIKELRKLAEQALGDRFDIRAFHDEILGYGCVPLSTLESRMKAWINRQR